MDRVIELRELFSSIPEVQKVYFQPPNNISMVYPCIRFQLSNITTKYADDLPYATNNRYLVTIIDENPLSAIPDAVKKFPTASFNNFYVAENLNHWVFSIM